MSTNLPPGWKIANLSDCCDILDNKRVPVNSTDRDKRIEGKKQEQLYPYYGATGQVGWIDGFLFDGEFLLLGEDGVDFFSDQKPKGYLIRGQTWVNNHAHVLRAIPGITSNNFLRYYLNQFDFHGYVTGTTRLKLNQEKMKNIPVFLPSIDEQKRIVTKLDRLLARVDSCRDHLDRAAKVIKSFRQSVLNAAVTGDLSKNWRRKFSTSANFDGLLKSMCSKKAGSRRRNQADLADNTLPVQDSEKQFEIVETWWWLRIKQVALEMSTGPFGSMLHKKDYVTNGIPVVNPTNIQGDKILPLSKMMVCSDTMKRLAKYCLSENDIVIARRGDLSKCAVVTGKESGWLCGTGSFFLKVGIDPDYFRIFYISEFCQKTLLADAIGSTMVNLNQKVLANIPIPVPPMQEQLEIVKTVKELNNFADQLESKLTAARERVDNLTASILAKAFRGELLNCKTNEEKIDGD